MKIKTFYINEGRNFDISQPMRDAFEMTGFKFYTPYQGYRKGDSIHLFLGEVVEGQEIRFIYNPDIFVH